MGLRARALVFISAAASVPYLALAQENSGPFAPIIAQPGSACFCPGSAPDWGCVLQTVQNVFTTAISVGVLIFVLWIAYTGFMLMTSGANVSRRQVAKEQILKGVVGLAVLLSAFMIVDFAMKVLYNPDTAFNGTRFGPWNDIWAPKADGSDQCIVATEPVPITSGFLGIAGGSIVGSAPGTYTPGATAGGKCSVRTSGPCAEGNFGMFGAAASQASQICSAESGNGTMLEGDKTTSGRPVSFGLFQINTTVHKVAGLNCPAAYSGAYTGSNKNIRIVNERLYQECRTAALNPAKNAAYAADLYKRSGNSWRQWSTARVCSLP